jgi:hypothetical protein
MTDGSQVVFQDILKQTRKTVVIETRLGVDCVKAMPKKGTSSNLI